MGSTGYDIVIVGAGAAGAVVAARLSQREDRAILLTAGFPPLVTIMLADLLAERFV